MNNVSLMDWLLWYFGSCLSGTPTGMIVNFYGETNAKQTLVNFMKTIFGDYYAPLPIKLLTKCKNSLDKSTHKPLSGIRLTSIDFGSEEKKLDTTALLNIITASFSPIILSDLKIPVSVISTGGKLPFCFVPFYKTKHDDNFFVNALTTEAPAILSKLIYYSHKYIQNDYKLPQCNEIEIVKV